MFDDNQKIITAQRLKELRNKKNLSHEKLHDELKKININVSVGSLKAYEVTDIYHSKFHSTKGMSIETLYGLAGFYNVSSDYLLGLTDNPTTEAELRTVCDYTGLSWENIEVITLVKDLGYKHIIKSVINDKFFLELIHRCGMIEELSKELQGILNGDTYKQFQSENKKLENEFLQNQNPETFTKMIANVLASEDPMCDELNEKIDIERYRITKYTERLMNIFDCRVNKEEKGNGEYYPSKE